ncbi:MAG TPA: guanylate kinase [Pyrinomonadaceae bacterium]|nr:guanylate kinase [Pyrinomonadaceae bacterium]
MSEKTTRELTADALAAMNLPEARGILFVVSSPSGGGKGTLIRRVLPVVPRLGYSVSWTTREPRAGEQDGVHYFFVSEQAFAEARERGEFLEWAVVHGKHYGTSLAVIERELGSGRDVILEIDVQGAESVRRAAVDSVGVFILPPSFEVLRERLTNRASESPEQLVTRLRNSRGELARYTEFDYVLLNDDADRAARQLASIILAERARRQRQERLARAVLATFPDTAASA